MKFPSTLIVSAIALTASTFLATAQDAARPGGNNAGGRGGDRGGNRGGTPEEFRQRMNDRLKTSLKMTDEEWTAIQPLIEKVQTKQRDAMGSRFGGFGGRGGDQGNQPARPGQEQSEALRKALEAEGTSTADLTAKLAAVRDQRKKAAAELAAVREDLRKVLTVRQEAALVSSGILE